MPLYICTTCRATEEINIQVSELPDLILFLKEIVIQHRFFLSTRDWNCRVWIKLQTVIPLASASHEWFISPPRYPVEYDHARGIDPGMRIIDHYYVTAVEPCDRPGKKDLAGIFRDRKK